MVEGTVARTSAAAPAERDTDRGGGVATSAWRAAPAARLEIQVEADARRPCQPVLMRVRDRWMPLCTKLRDAECEVVVEKQGASSKDLTSE